MQGKANILPYYFYMCDMIPHSEHWRTALWENPTVAVGDHGLSSRLRDAAESCAMFPSSANGGSIRWSTTTGIRGISHWTKNYRTGLDGTDVDALNRVYPFYDPIGSLPTTGQSWWGRRACDSSSGTAVSAIQPGVPASGGDGDPTSTPDRPSAISLSVRPRP